MTDAERENLLEAAIIAPPLRVKGATLRPLSLGSYILLRRVGNALVSGEEGGDHIADVTGYLFAHTAPLDDVLVAAARGWTEAVTRWAFDLSPQELKAAIPRVVEDIAIAVATFAQPEPGEGDAGKAHGQPGPLPCSGE